VTTDTLQHQLCAFISPPAILGKQHYVQSDQLLFYVGISPLLSRGSGVMPILALFKSAEQNQCKQDASIYIT